MGNFTVVPDVTVGDSFPPSLWESAIMNNLNLGVARAIGGPTVLTGPAATVGFSSIPATFAQLLLVWSVRSDTAATSDTLLFRVNSDSGTNYTYGRFDVAGSTGTASTTSGATSGLLGTVAAASVGVSYFGVGFALFPNYAAALHPSWIGMGGARGAAAFDMVQGANTNAAAAISTLTLLLGSGGNMIALSELALYGLPA